MDYISVREAAIKWDISERRVQKLCKNTSSSYAGTEVKLRNALSSGPASIEHMGISFLAAEESLREIR